VEKRMSGIAGKESGFTLVELMISMAIAGIVMATMYSSYNSQQKAYVTQEQVSEMQQNLRAAMFHLERDIRMAGYDPTGKADAGIIAATSPTPPTPPVFQFTKDDNNDAETLAPDGDRLDANENITFTHNTALKRLVKQVPTPTGTQTQTIAENIDALNLVYLDEDGAVTTTLNRIRSVQICLVARTSDMDPGYSDPNVYRNLQNTTFFTPTGNDLRHRRKMLRIEIKCRNVGLMAGT